MVEATDTSDEVLSAIWTDLFASRKFALEESFQSEEV